MSKPNKKQPKKTVDIYCSQCKTQLLKYRKAGKGSLVKCFKERVVESYVVEDCKCQKCGSEFAREALIRGTPAYKMIGGKTVVK